MGKLIGIDLGTTFSAVAYVNSFGVPEVIPNRDGERTTPSAVFFEDSSISVGTVAKNAALIEPLCVVQLIKRQMGNPSYKFITEAGITYTPEEISAIILKRLKEDAEQFLDDSISGAVITVPAYFNDAQRKSTQDAGRIAGLNVLGIINEPTAAALAYCINKLDKTQTLLVYDLGGGTFDVTILEVSSGKINVKATGGDKNLGGFDWDNEIMTFLNEEFKRMTDFDLFESPESEQYLRIKSEEAKKALSARDKTNVFLSLRDRNVNINLTREKFEEITAPLLNKTRHIMEFVLEDANLGWNNIDKILLIGGSSRMKSVKYLISELFGKIPSNEIHPDEAVAMGAAIQASLIEFESRTLETTSVDNIPPICIQDVNSHSMGIVTFDYETNSYINSIVLTKNTPIPKKVSNIYYTVSDNQSHLLIQVTQGECLELNDTYILGEALLKIPPYPEGAPVEVFFSYDTDGIVHINVFDLTGNRSLGEIHIQRNANLELSKILIMTNKVGNLTIT